MRHTFYSLLLLAFIGTACQSKKDTKSDEISELDQQTAEIVEEVKARVPQFPTPDEFAARLQATGADYFDNIINDPEKANKYVNDAEEKVAVNLGIYFADLAYSSAYGQRETSMKLVEAIVSLSNRLGIEKGVMMTVAERYDKYVEVPDSVKLYIQEMSEKATDNLVTMGRHRITAIAYAGLYIEALHMGIGIIRNYPTDVPASMRQQLLVPVYHFILRQKQDITDVRDYLDDYIEGVQETPYYNDLIKLEELYAEVDYDKIMDSQDLNLIENDPNLVELAKTVDVMRSRLID